MPKELRFAIDGADYSLSFTRESVVSLESSGFKATDIEESPLTALPRLFEASFEVNHHDVPSERRDEILKRLGNKKELFKRLVEMYSEPYETLFGEPEEGKADWTANW